MTGSAWHAALMRMRTEHQGTTEHRPGGHTWNCSCGATGATPSNYASEAQARTRLSRHLQAAMRSIMAELETSRD